MRVLITGAFGMIGRKLTARLLKDGVVAGKAISELHLQDIVKPTPSAVIPAKAGISVTKNALDQNGDSRFRGNDGAKISSHTGDLAAKGEAAKLAALNPDVVFHLAGIVSGIAESDFDLGYRVNFHGTLALFDALRLAKISPRVVYTSTIAVFGAPFPAVIPDDFHLTPLTSYGAQKMVGEALLADYTRKGIFDGIGIRLPTICVRPGKANGAASSFFSGIIREPLAGQEAILPVPRDVVHTHASPRSAVNFLIHAAGLDGDLIGPRRNLTMPGVGVTVQEQIDALRAVAGNNVVSLIKDQPDEIIWAIVKNWPTRFDAKRARDLGFVAERNFEEIVRAHIADELNGQLHH